MPALRNPALAVPISVAVAGASVLIGLIVGLAGGRPTAALAAATLPLGLFLLVFVVVGLAIDALGGFPMRFRITTLGIHAHQGPAARASADATWAAGVLAGSPATAGAGLLARAERDVFLAWGEVVRLTRSRSRRYVVVGRRGGIKPLALWGPVEALDAALELARSHRGDLSVRESRMPWR